MLVNEGVLLIKMNAAIVMEMEESGRRKRKKKHMRNQNKGIEFQKSWRRGPDGRTVQEGWEPFRLSERSLCMVSLT